MKQETQNTGIRGQRTGRSEASVKPSLLNSEIFRFILPILLLLSIFSIPTMSGSCSVNEYTSFMAGYGIIGPANLINQTATATKKNKFTLTYDLVNVGSDITKVTINLFRLIEEDEEDYDPDNPWKLETTKYFYPPYQQPTRVIFEELKRGMTYSIVLTVTSAMASISTGEPWPDQDIVLKTIEYLWPKDQDLRASIENRFDSSAGYEKLSARWEGNAAGGYNLKVKHNDGSENPSLGPTPQKEIDFDYNEIQSWPIATASNITTESIDSSGNITGNVVINLVVMPCPNCVPLPICPPTPPPQDILYTDLESGILKTQISNHMGGLISSIIMQKANGNWSSNIVADQGSDSNCTHIGPQGNLLQIGFARIDDKWSRYDTIDPSQQCWERFQTSSCAPACKWDDVKFIWNPTQGGEQPDSNSPCSNDPNNYFDPNNTTAGGTIREIKPYHIVAGDNSSPVHYIGDFKYWEPLDKIENGGCETQPGYIEPNCKTAYWPQANVWGDFLASYISYGDVPGAKAIDLKTRYRLSEKNDSGVELYDNFRALMTDWAFFTYLYHSYAYDPAYTSDPYGMREVTSSLCAYSDPSCAENRGWRNCMESYPDAGPTSKSCPQDHEDGPGLLPWVPYTMLSNDNQTLFVILYSKQDLPGRIQARRILRRKENPSKCIPGHYAEFKTIFSTDGNTPPPGSLCNEGLRTDEWSAYLHTYVIVGQTEDAVMNILNRLSSGALPYTPPNYPPPQ